jgi:hypothetical protein
VIWTFTRRWLDVGEGDQQDPSRRSRQGRDEAREAEIERLKKEVAKLKMERDILKKPRPTSPRSRCEVRLRGEAPRGLAGGDDVRGARCLAKRLLRLAGASHEPRSLSDERWVRRFGKASSTATEPTARGGCGTTCWQRRQLRPAPVER